MNALTFTLHPKYKKELKSSLIIKTKRRSAYVILSVNQALAESNAKVRFSGWLPPA
jgi:hypothetical protein